MWLLTKFLAFLIPFFSELEADKMWCLQMWQDLSLFRVLGGAHEDTQVDRHITMWPKTKCIYSSFVFILSSSNQVHSSSKGWTTSEDLEYHSEPPAIKHVFFFKIKKIKFNVPMDSVQVGKAVFVKVNLTILFFELRTFKLKASTMRWAVIPTISQVDRRAEIVHYVPLILTLCCVQHLVCTRCLLHF